MKRTLAVLVAYALAARVQVWSVKMRGQGNNVARVFWHATKFARAGSSLDTSRNAAPTAHMTCGGSSPQKRDRRY